MTRPFLTAAWRHLVMVNWKIDPGLLGPLVPRGTELDPFEGEHYLSLVGFRFLDTRVLGLPIPFHRDFDEVNLRFYVRRRGPEGWRRAVTFIREIVPRTAVATIANLVYNEPYVTRPMRSDVADPVDQPTGRVRYEWTDRGRVLGMAASRTTAYSPLVPGSEPWYIAEHYWGYNTRRDGGTMEYRVSHPTWNACSANDVELIGDLAGFYGPPWSEVVRQPPATVFLAEGSAVDVHAGVRVPA
jgi:hypothetical protein